MSFLRTLGWLACVVYSTIPLFWLMVHPRAHRWRERERSPFRVLVPAWITMWVGMGALTGPWRKLALYLSWWGWAPSAVLFVVGIHLYVRSGAQFSWQQLGGLPEVRAGHTHDRLVTTGIRARVRHPVYLAHLCEMLAWSLGTGLLVCWLLTAFAIGTGAVMIRMEEAELEKRFGEGYRKYCRRVPAVLPVPAANRTGQLRLYTDGVVIRYESSDRLIWQVSIADLVCIGEYTNEDGPWLDDYFLVFGIKNGLWYEASFYDEGRDEAISTIAKTLGCELILGLANSASFASRILWPKDMQGQPLVVDKKVHPQVKRPTESRQL